MNEKETKRISKFLSLILRREPECVGLKLDDAGWTGVDELMQAVKRHGVALTPSQLQHIVATSDKQRFAFNEDGSRIRANQGHSIEVDLGYTPQTPPELLYDGTATRFLSSIREAGLKRMERHHVHLSAETRVTLQVAGRHGQPVLLTIRAGRMHLCGHVFFRSDNGVWLVDHVPSQFIEFPTVEMAP